MPPPAAPLSPTFVDGEVLLIAGINARYGPGPGAGIPAQWQRFSPHIGRIPGQVGYVTYGVIQNSGDDGGFDYLCGVEVSDFDGVPAELARLRIAPQRYAVFDHVGHVSSLAATIQAIWRVWLPASDFVALDAPNFEYYGPDFDAATGMGGVQVWVPVGPRGARP